MSNKDPLRAIAWGCGLSPNALDREIQAAGGRSDWQQRTGAALERLYAGTPIEEIVAPVDFMGRTYRWDKRACLIRPYSSNYVSELIVNYRGHAVDVLDVGCGAGHIIISLALELEGRFVGTDVSPAAIALASENAERHAANVELIAGDMFEGVSGRQFDIVLANLPYEAPGSGDISAEEAEFEPEVALFDFSDSRFGLLTRFLAEVSDYLRECGRIYLELPEAVAADEAVPGEPLVTSDGEPVGRRFAAKEVPAIREHLTSARAALADVK